MSAERLLSTTDAQVWAEEFMATFAGRIVGEAVTEGTMIGWFANAIETGRSAGIQHALIDGSACGS